MFSRRMKITDYKPVARDGQHQHGAEWANIEVSDEAMKLLASHLKESNCIPKPIDKDTNIPVQFTMNEKLKGTATVICGICKKELGTCTVSALRDK